MKKKSLIALLALIVACMFVFAACGDKADTNNGGSIADNTEASTELTTDENGEVFTPNEGTPLPLPTDNVTEPTEPSAPAGKTDAEKVADYVAVYGEEFADGFVQGFTSTGLTCTSAIRAEGTGILLTVNVNEYENFTAEQKATMQASYDQATPSLKASLSAVKALIPELSYVKIEMCEKDGDLIAVINIDFTEGAEITVPTTPTVTEPSVPAISAGKTDAEKVADYVALYREDITNAFESGFTVSGMTCESTVEAVGTGIVVTVKVNELDNLTADQKATIQDSYGSAVAQMGGITGLQGEIPEATYLEISVYEKDGDLIAALVAGNKY